MHIVHAGLLCFTLLTARHKQNSYNFKSRNAAHDKNMNKKTYGKVIPQGGGTSINAAPLKLGLRLAPLIELLEALRLLDINRFWRWTMVHCCKFEAISLRLVQSCLETCSSGHRQSSSKNNDAPTSVLPSREGFSVVYKASVFINCGYILSVLGRLRHIKYFKLWVHFVRLR